MRCDEARELITGRVDDELTATEQVAVEGHLKDCELCRHAFVAESRLKQQIRMAGREVAAPVAMRRAIERQMARAEGRSWLAGWFDFVSWPPALAAAMVLLATASLLFTRWPSKNIGLEALEMHQSILSGKTALVRFDEPAHLRRELAQAVGGKFAPVALDLSTMKLYPISGFLQKFGSREVLVTVYQGAGPTVTCFTFLGSEADAPEIAERFYDADMRLNFYSFTRGDLNGVLHREGGVICVLVSKMAPADLLAILRGKTAHA
jgi:hypothetical protein